MKKGELDPIKLSQKNYQEPENMSVVSETFTQNEEDIEELERQKRIRKWERKQELKNRWTEVGTGIIDWLIGIVIYSYALMAVKYVFGFEAMVIFGIAWMFYKLEKRYNKKS
jgi:uncharacterized protein (DUF2225 family)